MLRRGRGDGLGNGRDVTLAWRPLLDGRQYLVRPSASLAGRYTIERVDEAATAFDIN
jgi:hypothetical protein